MSNEGIIKLFDLPFPEKGNFTVHRQFWAKKKEDVKSLNVTKEDCDLIIMGLQMRKCVIETGSPYMTAKDIENNTCSGDTSYGEIRALSTDQMKLIIYIDGLISRIRDM